MVFIHINIKVGYISILRKCLSLLLFYVDATNRFQTVASGSLLLSVVKMKGRGHRFRIVNVLPPSLEIS